jgi:hypothetical protein
MDRRKAPSHKWRTARRIFAGGMAYSRKGDFDQRITSRTRGVNCEAGLFNWYSQWADPPDPQDDAILTLNNAMTTLTDGFSAAIGPPDPSSPYHVFRGFYHYTCESNAPADRYGTHFGMSRLQFPIALVALPACLLFAALLRRTLRRRSNAARGFAVLVEAVTVSPHMEQTPKSSGEPLA